MAMNTPCPHCARHKERSPGEYRRLMNRLSRIEGQIRGIRGMVENGAYCPDILVQSAAVNAAINAFNQRAAGQPYPHLRAQRYPGGQRRGDRRIAFDAAEADEINPYFGGQP